MTKFNMLQMFTDPVVADYVPVGGVTYNTNVTGQTAAQGGDLAIGMKTFYNTRLLENSRANLVFAQFGLKQSLPKNNGKSVEWRKWNTYSRIQVLQEGITPTGEKFGQSSITASVTQHGAFSAFSDVLDLTHVDPVIAGATEEYGAAMADSRDLDVRDVLMLGTNVMFPPSNGANPVQPTQRATKMNESTVVHQGLVEGCYLTPKFINKVATVLKKNKAPTINGKYVAIVHPSVAMDLRNSDGWLDVHKYSATTEIFNGEIGELHGVRFVETTNAKVLGKGAYVDPDTPTAEEAATKSGNANLSVYCCWFFGKDAWGIIDPAASGSRIIVKGLGSAGTADPLEQRSTVGVKYYTGTAILYPERMVRVECTSSFGGDDTTN
jgi:N4-gp56 family major capsid protein